MIVALGLAVAVVGAGSASRPTSQVSWIPRGAYSGIEFTSIVSPAGFPCVIAFTALQNGGLRVSISIPTEPSAPMDVDEGTGLIEPAAYLIGVAGLQINFNERVSMVLELGAGGLFPLVSSHAVNPDVTNNGMGGALYGLIGVNLRL